MRRAVHVALSLLALMAAGGPAAAQAPAPLSNEGFLGPLIDQLKDPTLTELQRMQVANALGQWASPAVRPTLVRLLGDASAHVRAAAARGLGWPGNGEAIQPLRQRIDDPAETADVKAAALRSLGTIGDVAARPVVLAATSHPDASVRDAALWSVTFGGLADKADRVPLLVKLVEDTGADLFNRSQAIQALVREQARVASPVLIQVLESGPRSAIAAPPAGINQQQVMELRYRQARDVRAWAAIALGDLYEKAAVPVLMKTAEEPGDYFLRMLSIKALEVIGAAEAAPVMLRRLSDAVAVVRAQAAVGLGGLRDRSAVPALRARLTDDDPEVRRQVAAALGQIGDPSVRADLEALRVKDTDPNVQLSITEALEKLGG